MGQREDKNTSKRGTQKEHKHKTEERQDEDKNNFYSRWRQEELKKTREGLKKHNGKTTGKTKG